MFNNKKTQHRFNIFTPKEKLDIKMRTWMYYQEGLHQKYLIFKSKGKISI